jgi:4-hydroxy-3-polyprenylbenzoate decarboxylase
MPAVTAMYVKPASIADLIDHTAMRICDQLGIETELSPRWAGLGDRPGDGEA